MRQRRTLQVIILVHRAFVHDHHIRGAEARRLHGQPTLEQQQGGSCVLLHRCQLFNLGAWTDHDKPVTRTFVRQLSCSSLNV